MFLCFEEGVVVLWFDLVCLVCFEFVKGGGGGRWKELVLCGGDFEMGMY